MSEYIQSKFDSKSFNPVAFGAYVEQIPSTKRNELIRSRALRGDPQIRSAFSNQTGTAFATLPMTGRIGGEPVNYDGVTDIAASSTTTYERGVVVIGKAKAWTEKDFSTDITGGMNFMDQVGSQVSDYWDEQDQKLLLRILKGIFSMSGAENQRFIKAHTLDITAVSGQDKDINPKNCVGPTTLNTAIQQAGGDNKAAFTIAVMHSAVATNLENLRLLSYLKYTDSNGVQRDLSIGTWNGRAVLIDDAMPTEEVAESTSGAGDGYTQYTTFVLGDGAFSYEDIGAKVPFEMFRDPKASGGEDTLYSRQRKVFAPYGISWTRKTQATNSPTDLELENGQRGTH